MKVVLKDVVQSILDAKHEVQVLMGYGDGSIKRKLGLQGDYRKHLDAASKFVIDNSFYVTTLLSVIYDPGIPFLSRLLIRRYQKRRDEFNDAMGKMADAVEAADTEERRKC